MSFQGGGGGELWGGGGGGGSARMTGSDADSSITTVGKTHDPVSTFGTKEQTEQSQYVLASLPLLLTSSSAIVVTSLMVFHNTLNGLLAISLPMTACTLFNPITK